MTIGDLRPYDVLVGKGIGMFAWLGGWQYGHSLIVISVDLETSTVRLLTAKGVGGPKVVENKFSDVVGRTFDVFRPYEEGDPEKLVNFADNLVKSERGDPFTKGSFFGVNQPLEGIHMLGPLSQVPANFFYGSCSSNVARALASCSGGEVSVNGGFVVTPHDLAVAFTDEYVGTITMSGQE